MIRGMEANRETLMRYSRDNPRHASIGRSRMAAAAARAERARFAVGVALSVPGFALAALQLVKALLG